jgi:flagellar basal-body rod modification protein FlgD
MSSITASSIQADYMKLLITQLKNQNPLEPLDNNEMAAQLAQFSQLQQLESMNSNFEDVLAITKMNYASSLIGKNISFIGQLSDGTIDIVDATVEKIYTDENGNIILSAGGYDVNLEGVIAVQG